MNEIKGGDGVLIVEHSGYFKVYDYGDDLYIFLGPDKQSLRDFTIKEIYNE